MQTLPIGMPILGLGTWKAAPGEVGQAVKTAIELGYRHIDCAEIYRNEAEIGEALEACFEEGIVTRDELWVTSKLWNDSQRPDLVRQGLQKTLDALLLDHLDLYLVHWPVPLHPGSSLPLEAANFMRPDEISMADTWQALEGCVEAGFTRHIGVSNFSVSKIDALLPQAKIQPAVNQVELHPYLQQQALVDYCADKGIVVTAYSPLGSMDRPETMKGKDEPVLLQDPVIQEIAGKRGMTPAQVLLAWAVARGTSVIPKSTNRGRLAENLAAAELELTAEDLERIAQLDRHRRYVDGSFWAVPGGPHTVESLWS